MINPKIATRAITPMTMPAMAPPDKPPPFVDVMAFAVLQLLVLQQSLIVTVNVNPSAYKVVISPAAHVVPFGMHATPVAPPITLPVLKNKINFF